MEKITDLDSDIGPVAARVTIGINEAVQRRSGSSEKIQNLPLLEFAVVARYWAILIGLGVASIAGNISRSAFAASSEIGRAHV